MLRLESLEPRLLLDAGSPLISELMATGNRALADQHGDFSDWIEIHNPAGDPVDLDGWYLTDDQANLDKWRFPAVTVEPGDYLVVFASDKDRVDPRAELHTNFKLRSEGEYLALVRPDGFTVAHAYAPEFPPQSPGVSYGLAQDGNGVPQYFGAPTPGAANEAPLAATPEFSRNGGTFTDPFDLTLRTDSPLAAIHYTLDGSVPTASSAVYTGPIPIDTSTMVRATALASGHAQGHIASEGYVALADDVQQFDSNLPVVIIDTFGVEVDQAGFAPVYTTFVATGVDGRAAIDGAADFVGRGGLRIRGTSSTRFPKKQFALETWDEADEDRAASILAMPEESDWILQAPYSDKTLMRNHLVYQWSNRLGRYAVRTRFVEVFLNQDGDELSASDYAGVYVFMEKIKRDENRVDVQDLSPSDVQPPEITGGYILKRDRLGEGDSGLTTNGGLQLCYEDPKEQEITAEQAAWLTGYLNEFEAVLCGPDFADPADGYAKYIDVDSFIDYHILVNMTNNVDGLTLSAFLYKDRGGKLTAGPVWDYNLALGNVNYTHLFPADWLRVAHPWYRRLFEDPSFQRRYAQRWTELRSGTLATERLLADIDAAAGLLDEAQARNFQRWPVLGTYVWPNAFIGQTYQEEIDSMKQWLVDRLESLDSQYLGATHLAFSGSDDDDLFEFDAARPDRLVINGVTHHFDAAGVTSLHFDGRAGHDTVLFAGTDRDDTVELWPDRGVLHSNVLQGDGRTMTVVHVESITAEGRGGHDRATLYDSPHDDLFAAGPGGAAIRGQGCRNEVLHFERIVAQAGDGDDTAQLFDSPGDDVFVANPQAGALYGQGFFNRAESFESLYAYSTAGGHDVASLYDSPGDDHFAAGPAAAALFGDRFFNRAKSFAAVYACATAGGHDVATLYDSPGDDHFAANSEATALYGEGFFNRAKYFEETHAHSTGGGLDEATLFDATLRLHSTASQTEGPNGEFVRVAWLYQFEACHRSEWSAKNTRLEQAVDQIITAYWS